MRIVRHSSALKLIAVGAVFLPLLTQAGCVERRLTINTEPPGAIVWLNDEEIGISPVTVEFNWYGDYKVRISKEGCETLNTHRELKAPLHDGFPIDFFAEVIWPGRIVDEYEWSFRLEEYQPPERAELIEAAQQMQQTAAAEFEEGMRQQAQEQQAKDKGQMTDDKGQL